MLPQLLANGLVNGCLLALMALGFALIYNTTRILHIAHAVTYTGSAYICFDLLIGHNASLPMAIAGSLAAAVLFGVLVECLIYAPLDLKSASPLVALLASLGLYVACVNAIAWRFGDETQILRSEVEPIFSFAGVTLTRIQLAQAATALVVLPLVVVLLKYSTQGRIIRAVRDDPRLSQVLGASPRRVRAVIFALGSFLAGAAAVLSALDTGIDPNAGLPVLLMAVVALIVGGIGTFEGPVLGAFLLGVLQSLVVWKIEARWTEAIVFSLLILFLQFRPQGIMGRHGRLEESAK